ncbi:MAG: hypothetical protein A2V88_04135 [Elusimicrobia bacterium RBG_16_66_12]|nr:MAG: hypothetical protein A2V88_04135 [Elusimicrobia bacterium RBG_16_66_12]
MRRSYRQSRRRLRAARRSGAGLDRHALRKSVKRLRAQLGLLRPDSGLLPGLERLARLLGDERDLALLLRSLPRRTKPSWASAVAERAQRRRGALARRALTLARALLAAPARDFARGLRR